MNYVIIIELSILIVMILVKAVLLRRNGIAAFKIEKPDKNAIMLVFIIVCFVYAALSGALGLPFPSIAGRPFWQINIFRIFAVLICTVSLIWMGISLIIFGNSFRIGIDEKTNAQLIRSGTFAISRNPVFLAFITFFLGIFLMYSNMITLTFLILLVFMVHRQILREEKFLKNHYGKEYEDYCAKVKRYI